MQNEEPYCPQISQMGTDNARQADFLPARDLRLSRKVQWQGGM